VAEMARVVRAGGLVTAYAWDMLASGGFPYESLQAEMQGLGIAVPQAPSRDASRIAVLRDLWSGAGLVDVETRELVVHRTFADFDDYWATVLGGPSVGRQLKAMSSTDVSRLQSRMRERLPTDAAGQISYTARANAIKGRVWA